MVTKCPKLIKSDSEGNFQKKVIKWLRDQGCWVMKITPMAGVPTGASDLFFCKDGFYGFLECKKSKIAKRQPGQEAFVKKMNEWSYAKMIWPANWEETKAELGEMLK